MKITMTYAEALDKALQTAGVVTDDERALFISAFRLGWASKEDSLPHDEELIVYQIGRAAQDYGAAIAKQPRDTRRVVGIHERFNDLMAVARDHLHSANIWKEQVMDMLVIDGIFNRGHLHNPTKAITELIAWNVTMALDPAISPPARALQFKQEVDAAYSATALGSDVSFLLARALGTLEPYKVPAWAYPLSDMLQPTDHVSIQVKRSAA